MIMAYITMAFEMNKAINHVNKYKTHDWLFGPARLEKMGPTFE